MIINNVIL